ncbi:hypothetical protein J6590_087921 [Homalodisca vitripennis]|nr:hypothetical protein J6590_087921 [Homalodisca vitripennis]
MSLVVEDAKKGRSTLLYDNNKFRESYVLKSGEIIWRCLGRSCKAIVRTDASRTAVTVSNGKHTGPHPVTMRSLMSPGSGTSSGIVSSSPSPATTSPASAVVSPSAAAVSRALAIASPSPATTLPVPAVVSPSAAAVSPAAVSLRPATTSMEMSITTSTLYNARLKDPLVSEVFYFVDEFMLRR